MSKVLLVRDTPHKASEHVLRRKLVNYGIDPQDVHYEYVIDRHYDRLFIDGNRLVPSPQLSYRFKQLKEIKEALQPKVVLLAGELSLKALTEETKIWDTHCYVFDGNIIPMLDPKDLYYQPSNTIWMDIALSKAQLILEDQAPQINYSGTIKPSLAQVLEFCREAQGAELLSIDIEKTRREPHELTTIGLATSASRAISVPLGYSYWTTELEAVMQALRALLSSGPTKIFHNFIFDTLALNRAGLPVSGPYEDTMNLFHLLHPELKKSLKDAGRFYLFVEPWKKDDRWELKSHNELEHWNYNLKDVQYTLVLYQNLREALRDENLEEYYETYSKPLYEEILKSCARGVNIDHERLAQMEQEFEKELGPVRKALLEKAAPYLGPGKKKKKKRAPERDRETGLTPEEFEGLVKNEKKKYKLVKRTGKVIIPAYDEIIEDIPREFNPASPLQVKEVLENMGMKIPRIKGKESTDENSLLKLNRKYGSDFIPELLRFRELSKILTTYCGIAFDDDRRLRYSFNIAGTFGARLSSDKTPWDTGCNIQNFPKQFRVVVIPDRDKRLFQVDLSQAELRIVAWLSQDPKLIRLLDLGEDLHQHTADVIRDATGIEASRQLGKTVNHARNYGCGPAKLADQCLIKCNIPMTVNQARDIIEAHSSMFPQVTEWKTKTIKQVQKDRFITTPTGRKATFLSVWSDKMERQILNFVPQSTVADVINLAWIRLGKYPNIEILQQGHDSLLLQSECDIIGEIDRVFKSLEIPIHGVSRVIPHDVSSGQNWGEL